MVQILFLFTLWPTSFSIYQNPQVISGVCLMVTFYFHYSFHILSLEFYCKKKRCPWGGGWVKVDEGGSGEYM